MTHKHLKIQTFLLLLLLPIFLGGCGLAKLSRIQSESNLTVVESTLAKNLGTLERLGLKTKTARAHASYSGFLEDKMEDAEIAGDFDTANELRSQAIGHYVRAEEYAFKVLEKTDKTFKEARNVTLDQLKGALQKLKKKQVEPLFWAAYAMARGISLQKDDPMQVIDLDRVEAMMQRVLELDDTFYFGGAYLFYAVYYGDRSPAIGGDPEKAKEYLDKVDELNEGKFLLVKFYRARYYAYPKRDLQLYKQMLQ
ncbi:hypothetical protein F4Y93_11170, partial [Candidatus Poribacteria bacterium]|nr:hypothetical protein [Candidatus Poribacteria bacterium]